MFMKKLKEYSKEELETLNYDDIAYLILEAKKKKMKISDLFNKVCELLELDEGAYADYITDFFELLTTDKRFIQLNDGYWDLKTKHSEKVIIEDDEDEFEEIVEDVNEEEENEEESDFYDEDNEDDDSDDDLKDLVVIDDEDEEN